MRNASPTTEAILERLQEAADSLERSTQRGRKSFRRFYRDTRDSARDTAHDAHDALSEEWESIKSDLADLMNNADLTNSPEAKALIQRIRGSISEASDAVSELADNARRRAQHSAEVVDEYVHESPWATAGVAAVVGLAVGLLIAQSGSRR